ESLSLLDKMKELDEKPNEVIFTSLINKAKILEESLTFLEKMQEFGVKPDEGTFNSLINKVNTYDESFSLVDKMKEYDVKPDEVAFNALINKAGTFEESLTFLDKMKELDVKPNEVTFTSLIKKAGSFEDALTCLTNMEAHEIKGNEFTFGTLFKKTGSFKDAMTCLEKMEAHDIKPNRATYATLISQAGTAAESLTFLEKMAAGEIKPDAGIFATLIRKAESFKDALSFLQKMKEGEVKTDETIFTALIEKAENFMDIIELVNHIKAHGVQPNRTVIDKLLERVRKAPDTAMETLFENLEPAVIFGNFNFNRMISEAIRTDVECFRFIEPHVEVIAQQKDATLLHYARSFEYNGKNETALTLLDSIKKQNFDFYNIKANCLKKSEFQQAFELYLKALESTGDWNRKSIVYNNAAQLVFDHKRTDMYGHAIEHCKKALSLRPFSQFPFPGHLLLLFTIHESAAEELKANVDKVLKGFRIPVETLSGIREQVQDESKKKLLSETYKPVGS
ncbi:MAG: hypothetical protein GY757_56740, partial [bacterium]|nr:hypothetical protein [bacterium]